jgi:hypothetical protein
MLYRVLGVAQYCNQITRFETESETKSKGATDTSELADSKLTTIIFWMVKCE